MNLLVIGDPHAHPDYDNDRFTALGKFIASEKPDVIAVSYTHLTLPTIYSE